MTGTASTGLGGGFFRAVCLALFCLLSLPFAATRAEAHPFPNSVISLGVEEHLISLDIGIPAPELMHVLTGDANADAGAFLASHAQDLRAYLAAHIALRTGAGAVLPVLVRSMSLEMASDVDAGEYEQFRFRLEAPVPAGADARNFQLRYDAVIHQIPNHFALARIDRNFRAGLVGHENGVELGVIKYDFAAKAVPPLNVNAEAGSLFSGFAAMVTLGLVHVAGGLDHILFLATLLFVAPLRNLGGSWSLFQGFSYSIRRFLFISIAFTIGHSAALAAGAYELLSFDATIIEVLIAVSILLAAAHAFRPIVAGREWMLAGGFGLIHGLAFSGSLSGLHLPAADKAIAILGFNIGVESAQLLVMAVALPVLLISRYKAFHLIRQTAMAGVAALALIWIGERAFGWPLPGFLQV